MGFFVLKVDLLKYSITGISVMREKRNLKNETSNASRRAPVNRVKTSFRLLIKQTITAQKTP